MLGWILFVGLICFDLGFFAGCVFVANRKISERKEKELGTLKALQPLSDEEKQQLEKEQRQQMKLQDDINFLNNFNGEVNKDE